MFHKVIFIVASAVIFAALDLNWICPLFFNSLPQTFSWIIAFTLAGFEISALIAEWYYLDWKPIAI